jgi:HAD superfamily hydrolase (TIGR01509 family)
MRPDLILFDLGGVLADLGEPAAQMALPISDEQFWATWSTSKVVQAFEVGDIGADEFLRRFPQELELTESPEFFLQRFGKWQVNLFPAVDTVIRRISEQCGLALLSNINVLHWQRLRGQSEVFALFEQLFLSFEIGRCKPANDAFEYVLRNVSAPLSNIIYLDDLKANIDSARRLGIPAVQVQGLSDVCSVLTEHGFDMSFGADLKLG